MTRTLTLAAVAALLLLAAPVAAQAPRPDAPGPIAQAQATEEAKPSRRSRRTTGEAGKKEPTVGQMAARERQRKCGVEWREMKQAGKVQAGMRWPQFWSKCNARLKGNAA